MASGSARGTLMSWNNKLTALLVEAPSTCRMIGNAFLEAYGVDTEVVDTGEAAVDIIGHGANFNVILIDMHMQDMKGPECARRLREMGVQSKLFGMEASLKEHKQQEFLAAGVDGFMKKPLHPSEFVPVMQDLDDNQE